MITRPQCVSPDGLAHPLKASVSVLGPAFECARPALSPVNLGTNSDEATSDGAGLSHENNNAKAD